MFLKTLLSALILCLSAIGWADSIGFTPIEVPEQGVGRWQEVPFGKVRILSCTTGVKDLSMVVGGLQVQLNADWTMKKPTLRPLLDEVPVWMETPVRPGSGRNTVYQNEVFFPIVYARNASDTNDFELGVQGDFPVCQEKKCMILPLKLSLPLTAEEADYTKACAYILKEQMQAPLMAKAQGVTGNAWLENGQLIMAFHGIKSPLIALLQTTGEDVFQVLETQLEKTGLIMRVKTSPWKVGQKKDWILITNKGVFRVPVKMQNFAIALPASPVPLSAWWMGWELFFFTPLFIWWGLGMTKTNKEWKKQIKWFCLILPVIFIGRVMLSKYISFDKEIYGILLLSAVCLFPPTRKSLAWIIFFVWPFFPQIPDMTGGTLVIWFLIVGLEILIPFCFLYLKMTEIGKVLRNLKKKNFFLYNLIFLLPTVYLLGGYIFQSCQTKQIFHNKLNSNGISVIVDEKKVKKWKKIPNATFIFEESMLGYTLEKMYGRKGPVIIWQDRWGRVILSPDSSLSDVSKFISNWKNYHALYKP